MKIDYLDGLRLKQGVIAGARRHAGPGATGVAFLGE